MITLSDLEFTELTKPFPWYSEVIFTTTTSSTLLIAVVIGGMMIFMADMLEHVCIDATHLGLLLRIFHASGGGESIKR
jgi:hypothetical protein